MSTFKFTLYDKNTGEPIEHSIPATKAVCPRCRGEGTHTNPSIDGNGITGEEWAEWDDEDRQTYMSGGYDVRCETCEGVRVVDTPDLRRCTRAQRKAYREHLENEAESRRDYDSERHLRMMESGERW